MKIQHSLLGLLVAFLTCSMTSAHDHSNNNNSGHESGWNQSNQDNDNDWNDNWNDDWEGDHDQGHGNDPDIEDEVEEAIEEYLEELENAPLFEGTAAETATVAPNASPARPFNLPLGSEVYEYASDPRSQDFYTNVMPEFLTIINDQLSESVEFVGRSGFKLDASKLLLRTESDMPIRIYFLMEGAGYHNSVGFSWTPAGGETGDPHLLFPDASIRGGDTRTTWEPLKVGDFTEIGVGGNGFQLDFFLISNAVNGGQQWLWNDPDLNPDALQHMVAFMIPNSRYILLGFEDIIGGGDLDYNDALFVVDIGAENAQNLFDEEGTLPH